MLAVIGSGDSVTGFEAAFAAHGRSTVGGDTRPSVSAHDSWPPLSPTIEGVK
jgi:hypothetical protein